MSKYAVIDLEMCRVRGDAAAADPPFRNELIQIGAVLLDEDYDIIDSFMTLCAPRFGSIDPYIERLTGISPADTVNAPSTEEALAAFVSWLPEDAALVSWSENDEIQIRRELEFKEIELPELEAYLDTWIDCQQTFADLMDNDRQYRLSEALVIADIDSDEGAHDALIDARNTAMLFRKMETEPDFKLNSWLSTEEDVKKGSGSNPFAALLANYKVDD